VGNPSGQNGIGDSLYNLLWKPLTASLKKVTKISYSPAGKLYTVAFHAIPVGRGKVLMDKYKLEQYMSIREIALRKNENKESIRDLYLFGNAKFSMDSAEIVNTNFPKEQSNNLTNLYTGLAVNRSGGKGQWEDLPGTAIEVEEIKKLFENNKIVTKVFVREEATEENLKKVALLKPQILHIATHGFFEPMSTTVNQPDFQTINYNFANEPLLRSGLVCAGANYVWLGRGHIKDRDDGIATAYEIAQLNLNKTDLVVLSACESALGDIIGSEGVFGLQRAFKMAGVKQMILSLWEVPDKETSELMMMFYRNWLKLGNIEDAFYQTQMKMKNKYPKEPNKWAAWVLVR
jgi:CHAT domain-containing protein